MHVRLSNGGGAEEPRGKGVEEWMEKLCLPCRLRRHAIFCHSKKSKEHSQKIFFRKKFSKKIFSKNCLKLFF